MAATFKVGQEVKVNVTQPQGEVLQIKAMQDGSLHYLIGYEDANGVAQERWLDEDVLVAV